MGAPEVAQTLPLWAVYTIGGLAATCGLFFAFVLGLVKYAVGQRGRTSDDRDGGDDRSRRDCSDCPSVNRVTEGLNALNSRIDRILEIRAGG